MPVILGVLFVAVGAQVLIRVGRHGYAIQPAPSTRPTGAQRLPAAAPRRGLARIVRVRPTVVEPLLTTTAPDLQNPLRGPTQIKSRLVELQLVTDHRHAGERAVARVLEHFNPAQNLPLGPGRFVEVSVTENSRGQLDRVEVIKPAIRFDTVVLLGVAFLVLVLVVGQRQGLRVALALGVCGWAALKWLRLIGVTWAPVPTTILFGGFVVVAALLLVTGPNRKSASALAGVVSGVAVSAAGWSVAAFAMGFNGRQSGAARMLFDHARRAGLTFDFAGLAAAAVIVIVLGLVLDVAISVASAVWEVCVAAPATTRRKAWLAGMAVGRDVGSTMVLTLVFAMLGTSLPVFLYPSATGVSPAETLSGEAGAALVARTLVCGIGMLLVVPATAACAAFVVPGHARPAHRPVALQRLADCAPAPVVAGALALLLALAPERHPAPTAQALALAEHLQAIDSPDRALAAARAWLAEERFDAAVLALWRAEGLDPGNIQVQTHLGHAYYLRGWLAQAVDAVQRVAGLDRDDPRIHQFLGRLYQHQGRDSLAVTAFLRAVALSPDDVDILCDLATAYTHLGDNASAEQIVRRAYALAPTNPRVAELIDALQMQLP